VKFESDAAAYTTRPTRSKSENGIEGTCFINGKKGKVQFDTGRTGAKLISAAFVTTYGIPCIEMKEPTKRLKAIKGSRSERLKEYTVDLAVGKLGTKGNMMLVGSWVKYNVFKGMAFLKQKGAIIKYSGLPINFKFPEFGIGSIAYPPADIFDLQLSPRKP